MKRKTINAIITKKFNEWVDTIKDDVVKKLVQQGTVCTGGCIASMLLNEAPNDFDFYFKDFDTALAVAHYYVGKFKAATGNNKKPDECQSITIRVMKPGDNAVIAPISEQFTPSDPATTADKRIAIVVKSAGVASETQDNTYMYFEQLPPDDRLRMVEFLNSATAVKDAPEAEDDKKGKYRPVFLSRNAISLSGKIQLVIRFYGDPDKIHSTYDFCHVTNFWTSWDGKVILREAALEALITKELRYMGSQYQLCSLFRMKKFIERGWHINAGTILKIAWNLKDYDLTNIAVLEEQLTGVDQAFFISLVQQLREKNPGSVDGEYLMALIDKMF
jgi:hypothetical protein